MMIVAGVWPSDVGGPSIGNIGPGIGPSIGNIGPGIGPSDDDSGGGFGRQMWGVST